MVERWWHQLRKSLLLPSSLPRSPLRTFTSCSQKLTLTSPYWHHHIILITIIFLTPHWHCHIIFTTTSTSPTLPRKSQHTGIITFASPPSIFPNHNQSDILFLQIPPFVKCNFKLQKVGGWSIFTIPAPSLSLFFLFCLWAWGPLELGHGAAA